VRSWIEISRSAIRDNFRAVKAAVGPVEVMPVVKADAYRHGAIEVSKILEVEGAQWLAVSNADEGIALREAGIAARILVMADYLPENRSFFKEFQLTPVIHSLADAAAAEVPYHLKIDSGMGRLGVRESPEEIARAVAPTPLEGLMTHFCVFGELPEPADRPADCPLRVSGKGGGLPPLCPPFEHHTDRLPAHRSLGQPGAPGSRDLRLRIALPRGPGRQNCT